MTLSQDDSVTIQEKLAPLILKKERVWQPMQTIGSFLTFQFGAKVPLDFIESKRLERLRKRRKSPLPDWGEWCLSIHRCAWRIEKDNEVLAGAEDTRPQIEAALQLLDRKVLISVEIMSLFLDTLFTFEDNLKLRTFSRNVKDGVHWKFFTPDDNVLSLGPASNWSYHKSYEPSPIHTNIIKP